MHDKSQIWQCCIFCCYLINYYSRGLHPNYNFGYCFCRFGHALSETILDKSNWTIDYYWTTTPKGLWDSRFGFSGSLCNIVAFHIPDLVWGIPIIFKHIKLVVLLQQHNMKCCPLSFHCLVFPFHSCQGWVLRHQRKAAQLLWLNLARRGGLIYSVPVGSIMKINNEGIKGNWKYWWQKQPQCLQ